MISYLDDRYFSYGDKLIKMEFGKIGNNDFDGVYGNIAATVEL